MRNPTVASKSVGFVNLFLINQEHVLRRLTSSGFGLDGPVRSDAFETAVAKSLMVSADQVNCDGARKSTLVQ